MNGVLRTLSLAALVLSLSFSPLPAKAGHYDVAYTGGQWANYLSSGYYSLTSGLYGAVQGPSSLQWASCSGTITATFTWVPDDVGDIPPKTAVLYQRCSAGATAMGDSPTATANNGLGDEPQVWQTETYISVTSSGEHYTIKPNPGTSFSVFCGASAYSACAGFISSSVIYEARAIPVILNLGGAIKANDGSLNILVGQGCTGSISAGEITLDNFQWTVPGETFASFDVEPEDQTWGHATEVSAATWTSSTPHWYWRKDEQDLLVYCTARASVNDQVIGTVYAERHVRVWAPYYFLGYNVGPVTFTQAYDAVQAGDGVGTHPGIRFVGRAGTPDMFRTFYGSAGVWQFVQLCDLAHHQFVWFSPIPSFSGTDGDMCLDNVYPYDGPWPADSVEGDDPLHDHETEDNPIFYFLPGVCEFGVLDRFIMYMMYLPPGTDVQWAPLHCVTWRWDAGDERTGTPQVGPWRFDPPEGAVTVTGSARWYIHPVWARKYTNTGG